MTTATDTHGRTMRALRDAIRRAVRLKPAMGGHETAGPVMCGVGG